MTVLLFFLMKRMFKNIIIIIGFSLIYRWATTNSPLLNDELEHFFRNIKKIGKAPERTFPI